MRAKPILVLGGACVVGLAIVHLNKATQEAQTTVPASRATPAEAVRHVVRSPPAEVRFALPMSTPSAAPAETDPARDRAVVERIENDLAERLRNERVDPSWAPQAERAIATAIGDPAYAGLRLDAVSCGATLCRVAITAGEQVTDVDGAFEELTTAQPLRAGGFLRMTGPRSATLFVARAGHKLPPPPRG